AASTTDIETIVIGRSQERPIKLKDVATVFMGYEEMKEEGRYNGQPTVVVDVFKQPLSPSMATSAAVRQRMDQAIKKMGGRLNYMVISDESEELTHQLLGLARISLLILVVIFLILLITVRDVRAALLIFSSVFFSVFATFTVIYIAKIPLNLLTLSGFALGFGMFVDNAVVVYDNILRLREKGMSPLQASIEGPRQIFVPVLASTLTTVIVFFSFAYFQGRLRIYYLPLAQTIAVALLSSVVVAYTLIPPLAARMNFRYKPYREGKGSNAYRFFFRYPLFVILPLVAAIFFSYTIFKKEVSFGQFFSWYQKQSINVWLRMPPGTEFEDTKNSILGFEKIVVDKPYEKAITTKIGGNFAFMEVSFPPEIEFSAEPYQLKQELISLATNMAGVGIGVSGFDPEGYYYMPDTGSFLPYSIQVKGYDFERLIRLADEIKQSLLLNRRVKEVSIQTDRGYSFMRGGKYYSLTLDYDAMRRLQIDPRHITYLIGSTLSSRGNMTFNRMRVADKEYDIELRLQGSENLELDELMNKEFKTSTGIPFRLTEVTRLSEKEARGGISRENQQYIAFINWDYLGSTKAGDKFHKAMYKNLEVPPGFMKSLEEQRWMMKEEEKFQLVQSIIISLFLIFLILTVLYESIWQTF
ncbi:MAG: efflux RND transporter permease subunit, partial [Dehalococcoidia bacterium]